MWKMPVARAPAFLLRRILSCAIAVAVLLSASVQDVHGQGWGLDYVWQLLGYDPPAGNGRWQTVGEQDFDRRVLKDRKSTRLNSSHRCISYAVFCLKKKKKKATH